MSQHPAPSYDKENGPRGQWREGGIRRSVELHSVLLEEEGEGVSSKEEGALESDPSQLSRGV